MIDKKIAIIGLIDDEYIEEATPGKRVLGNRAVILNVFGRVMSFISTGIGAAVSVAVVVILVIGAIAGPEIVEFIMEKVITTDPSDDQNTPQTEEVDPENVENGLITTAAELKWVLNNAVADKNYTVTVKELDMSGLKWNGIENYKGVFDFGGCTVSGARYPMFLSVDGGVVKNLVLANSEYEFTTEMTKKGLYVINDGSKDYAYSPIVCSATDITVSNVIIESSVSIDADVYSYQDAFLGGIVGHAQGSEILIEDCEFKGRFSVNASYGLTGGIAGQILSTAKPVSDYDLLESFGVAIQNCVNYGEIVLDEHSPNSDNSTSVAGIVGRLSGGAVHHCANYADLQGGGYGMIGGIISRINGDEDQNNLISECINTGRLYYGKKPLNSSSYIGGIVAFSTEDHCWIVNCVNIGEIETNPNEATGGIVGMGNTGERIRYCFNLSSSCKIFGILKLYGVINPADDRFTDGSANCLSVDQLYEKINAACPGVFVMSDGTIRLSDHL